MLSPELVTVTLPWTECWMRDRDGSLRRQSAGHGGRAGYQLYPRRPVCRVK